MPTVVPSLPETELLLRLRDPQRRERAFAILVEEHGPRLYHHLLRMLHRPADVDDVLQDTFVKAFRNLDGFRQESKLGTWLYRIATNEALSHLRRRQRTVAHVVSNGEAELLADRLRGEDYFDGDAAQALLRVAIGTLAPKQRAVFSMRYFDELPYREISAVTGTSVGSLKASFHQAAKKIECYLKKHAK